MRKCIVIGIAAVVAFSTIFCSSVDTRRMACEQGCRTAQDNCKKDLDKIKNKAQQTAKNVACNESYQKCLRDCQK